jgi:hypothetical protein
MYSFNEILENQKKFQKEIMYFFLEEYDEAKRELKYIKSKEEYIIKQRPGNHFKHLFFSKSKKNGDYYAWWDFNNEEVKIIKYEKR